MFLISVFLYLLYAYIALWWGQVCLNLLPKESGLDFDNMSEEKDRFWAILKLPFYISLLWPISIIHMMIVAGKEVVMSAIIEFDWDMTFKK